MNPIHKLFGYILLGIGKMVSGILEIIILITNFIVMIVKRIGNTIASLLSLGGCLFLALLGPVGFAFLMDPIVILSIALIILIPILGTKLVSYLKYIKYTITEFLFDHGQNLIHGIKTKSKAFNEYGKKYRKMEEDARRKEQQKRQAEQQRFWEERFRQWYEYQQYQGGSTKAEGSYSGQAFVNPSIEFKSKYEKCCNLLEVPYDADIYQIKLAYRKKAKIYHPDTNPSPDATRLFQEINNAYEFLNAENIERYKQIHKG